MTYNLICADTLANFLVILVIDLCPMQLYHNPVYLKYTTNYMFNMQSILINIVREGCSGGMGQKYSIANQNSV